MSRIKFNFFLLFIRFFGILTNRKGTVGERHKGRSLQISSWCLDMKTKTWIILFAVIAAACILLSLSLFRQEPARFARISSKGQVVKTVDLTVDQEFTVDGRNTVTVENGKIAVTWADCPDHYCMKRGFCAGGTDIVCLPNRLVITFLGDTEIDAAIG